MIEFQTILEVVTDFYSKATFDFLIGYQFRKIEDFDSHLPRIASFWELQLNGKITNREHLPFKLIEVHSPLKIKRGELGRWVTLFQETLESSVNKGLITKDQSEVWMEKIKFFENKLYQRLIQQGER
ncbi:MAG: hypothetical protein CME64_01915 [Halobacteriovoraceae bacterium]|nr:hypothetical protein [Halobacteriovoraceae bacterium]|tara:strand:- start:38479 stop:38859 length:381 start_codon:yes stop_codon:yes gene_type:complete